MESMVRPKCKRCGRDKDKRYEMCASCRMALADEKYLDDGSGVQIHERKDRGEDISADYFEQERELDVVSEEH